MANETKCRSFFYSAKGEFCELWAEKLEVDENNDLNLFYLHLADVMKQSCLYPVKHNVINA